VEIAEVNGQKRKIRP